ncbi:hypothetical protein [Aurantiacibacter aquimixticola]|nr:hypothetical protein [Aurantiacibacter aquimixticola]
MRIFAAVATPLVLLAACAPEAEEAEAPVEEAATAEPAENATLDLQATGIVVPPQSGFEQLAVPFGSQRVATEATLGNVLGEATGSTAGGDDCALATTQYDGLTAAFSDDQFVGYYATAPYVPDLDRAAMIADSGVEMVEGSTLGEEFTIGSEGALISGLFSGEGEDATVEALWAGENCIFR